ncbi:hypothetical protein SAMIE_1015540 [Sphingobium amiense]|uniref:Uncharacterized protein n=1 Tax=Sphingobium amiense TaxID=135719 RepID=A0A494W056_9SPHN|nr:hypothetical protein [Sphingobium amiense]BBD98053.1 hypothetical protein SAMIE_1015540 [Sphingobium amiense]
MTTLPEAVAQMIVVITNFAHLTDELGEWVTGTVAGTDGTGLYPFTQPDGTVIKVPSPLKMLSMIGGKYEGLIAAQAAQQQAVNNQLATFDGSVNQVKAWLSGPASGGLFGNGLYPITLSTGTTVNIPSPARLAADRQTVAAIVGSGSLIALVEDRTYATYADLIAAPVPANGKWALVHSDADYGRNGYWLVEAGFWVMKVSLASEALLTALGDNLRGLVRTQNIGRQAEPSKVGSGVTSPNLLLWNDSVQAGGKVTGVWLFAAATGTIRLQSYSKSGTTVTKKRTVYLNVTGTGYQLVPADMIVDAGDYIGLQGQGIITATSNTADAGGWWDILADLDTRTVGAPITTARLEAQLQISTVQQVVNAGAMLDMAAKVADLLTRASKAEAQLALLQGEITQTVGILRTPESGTGVSNSMFIWADQMAHDGYLNELRLFAVGTGTLRLARYSRIANEVTREQQVMIPITSTGLKTLTAADFGLFTLKAGEHIALYGPGVFTSKVETQAGLGWWAVNADANPRTVGAATTNIQLHVAFDVRQAIQTVTSDRILALEAQGADHEVRLATAEDIADKLFANDVQEVGRRVPPVDGSLVSDSHFIWNAPMRGNGTLTEVQIFVKEAGTFTLVRWSRVDNTVTRRDVRTFTLPAGSAVLTPGDFGGTMPFLAGEYVGLHGPFVSTPGAVDDGGWFNVVNGVDVRTIGAPVTSNRLEASFKFAQNYQVVTAERFRELEEAAGGGGSIDDGAVIPSREWLAPDAAERAAPLIGGRLHQRLHPVVGRRTLAMFDTLSNISNGDSNPALTEGPSLQAMIGASAVRITTTGGSEVSVAPDEAGQPVDVRGGQVRLFFRPVSTVFSSIAALTIELHSHGSPDAPTGNFHRLNPDVAPYDLRQRLTSQEGAGLWQSWGVSLNYFLPVGAGADLQNVRFAIFKVRSASGKSLSMEIGMIDFVPNLLKKAKAILSFDNGYLTHATYSAPQLIKRGFRGVFCLSQMTETHDVQNDKFCSVAQLRALNDLHGFQMASQAWVTEDKGFIDGLSENGRMAEMAKARNWMNAMGLTGGDHGSYFSAVDFRDLVAHNMFRSHFRSVRTFIQPIGTSGPCMSYGEMYPWGDPMRVRAVGATLVTDGSNGARLIAHAQQAVDCKGVAYFGFHNEQDVGSEHFNPYINAGFLQLLDWLDQHRDVIDVVTEDELHHYHLPLMAAA